jgi:DNA-binding NarL/FixJ family response regulator
MEIQQDPILILLASPSQDTLSRWKQGVSGFFGDVFCMDNLDLLRDGLVRIKPQILLLDHDLLGLDSPMGADLMKLSPETKVVILSRPLSDETEWELFKAGVKGCCQKNIETKQLKNVVIAVQQGELWMRRTLTCRLLDELGVIALEKNQIKQAASDLLANLTRREHEIATLVGNGESNKQIAQRLAITERTVKAHLTEVFRKLNVADRLKLALLVTGSMGTPEQARSNANGRPPSLA